MGIELNVYSLWQLQGQACRHHLLLRVLRPEYSNARQQEENAAYARELNMQQSLLQRWLNNYTDCGLHCLSRLGACENEPVGEEVSTQARVNVQIAQTRYGQPWVVFGLNLTEAAFWRELEADGDLMALGPKGPVESFEADFLTEAEDAS